MLLVDGFERVVVEIDINGGISDVYVSGNGELNV